MGHMSYCSIRLTCSADGDDDHCQTLVISPITDYAGRNRNPPLYCAPSKRNAALRLTRDAPGPSAVSGIRGRENSYHCGGVQAAELGHRGCATRRAQNHKKRWASRRVQVSEELLTAGTDDLRARDTVDTPAFRPMMSFELNVMFFRSFACHKALIYNRSDDSCGN